MVPVFFLAYITIILSHDTIIILHITQQNNFLKLFLSQTYSYKIYNVSLFHEIYSAKY